MLAHTKKHRTTKIKKAGSAKILCGSVRCMTETGAVLRIPLSKVKSYQISDKAQIASVCKAIEKKLESQLSDVFSDINEKYGNHAALLRGLRIRENLSQAAFAEKLDITQPELSKMETGKRPIGRQMAKRLESVFKTDYRLFL